MTNKRTLSKRINSFDFATRWLITIISAQALSLDLFIIWGPQYILFDRGARNSNMAGIACNAYQANCYLSSMIHNLSHLQLIWRLLIVGDLSYSVPDANANISLFFFSCHLCWCWWRCIVAVAISMNVLVHDFVITRQRRVHSTGIQTHRRTESMHDIRYHDKGHIVRKQMWIKLWQSHCVVFANNEPTEREMIAASWRACIKNWNKFWCSIFTVGCY